MEIEFGMAAQNFNQQPNVSLNILIFVNGDCTLVAVYHTIFLLHIIVATSF